MTTTSPEISTPAAHPDKLDIMPGYREKQFMHHPEKLKARLEEYPLNMCRWLGEEMSRRQEASRKLFKWTFFRGDCHSHTHHSDGGGTVAQTADMKKAVGLDFQFVTDHWGVTHAPECREHGLWIGQEPATQHHHLGILGLDHAFVPQMDLLKDVADVRARGGTPFIPHPTGWWPKTIYNEEQTKSLEALPDPFLMEICNGANNIVSAFDFTDDSAIVLWDHLLSMGKVIHAMGNTDAHVPHGLGAVWNSVFADRCDQASIVGALTAGHSFVSDGPLVHIALGKAKMGDRAQAEERTGKLAITAVDSRGLSTVKIIADGKTVAGWWCKSQSKFTKRFAVPASVARYVRVEVRSEDGRRAYSNPIYFG
jgi:hypothetical protein